MKQEFEFEQMEEGERLFFVRIEYECLPAFSDDGDPSGYDESIMALEVAEWGPEDIGPAMPIEQARKWVEERTEKLLEMIRDEQEAAYEASH